MSLTTLLLAFLPAVVQARREPEKSKRELEIDLADARRDVDALRAELERASRRNEELARARIEERLNPLMFAQSAAQQYQMQQNLAAQQANAQMANAQMAAMQNAYGQGLLGAQSLANSELWCNCVPARHDMLLGIAG